MTRASSRASVRSEMEQEFRFVVSAALAGTRLDQAISASVPELSRTRARALVGVGAVFVDGQRVKVASRKVRERQKVRVYAGQEHLIHRGSPQQTPPLVIVSETKDFIVVDKPSGMFSAPTPQTDRNDLLFFLREQHVAVTLELFLVHRLDRPTSGLMVLAKHRVAAARLSEQMAVHEIVRKYQALLVGRLEEAKVVELPLNEKAARSSFRPLEHSSELSWVEVELFTGRTHQVRRHAEAMGHPVVGDSKYGRGVSRHLTPRPPRLALHAVTLAFEDPSSAQWLRFDSEFPQELNDYWTRVRRFRPDEN